MDCIQINHDEPFLPLGPDTRFAFTWAWLHEAAEKKIPIQWNMLGEYRMLPVGIIVDAWRVCESYLELMRLGRGAEAPQIPWGFTWQQTVPISEIESPQNNTPTSQEPPRIQSEPTCPQPSIPHD